MQARYSPVALWQRLRSTYWFVPSLVTLATVVLAFALIMVERYQPSDSRLLSWAYSGGAAGARALLSAVAGSMITVVSVTFSVTVVALTVSSQHFGPRLLNNFMRDTAAQLVLGMFIGTFAYCLVVLRTIQDESERTGEFIPDLAVTGGVMLSLVSVGTLIYFVHHISTSLQVSEIANAVARDLERAIERLYPDPIGRSRSAQAPPAVPADAFEVRARESGYVQQIDTSGVMDLAREADTVIWIKSRPGNFITEGVALAAAAPPPREPEAFADRLRGAYVVGVDRTSYQDAGFAMQQLVEIALRGLSPGVNEPFTAITAIDRLGQGLNKLAHRDIPAAARVDSEGRTRVIAPALELGDFLRAAVDPIRLHASQDPVVAERLLGMLAMLAASARREADRRAILERADDVWHAADRQIDGSDKAVVRRAYRDVRRALDLPEDRDQATPA